MKRSLTFGLMALTLACGGISNYAAVNNDDIVILYRGNADEKLGYTGISVYADELKELTTVDLPVYDSPTIIRSGDTDVAFVGITRRDTGADNLYDSVQESVNAAITDGADYVIAVSHLGDDLGLRPWRSVDVVANTVGIDAMIDGNPDNEMSNFLVQNANDEDVIVTYTGDEFNTVGKILINPETHAISSEFLEGDLLLPYRSIYNENALNLTYPFLDSMHPNIDEIYPLIDTDNTIDVDFVDEYVIAPNDNLSTIAQNIYGDASRYLEIYELNSDIIENPNLIYPGQVLLLPI
ncbi:LysM peptidoglycan-binding domain-containing protein [Candidatus Epulonipiscium viviparus]|uniref:LysM peptidoglycan-binding domain-containing protein n=1 Tax=Candidatus Epulonipiscium viviparus TaxID=420336 RepID=UPI002738104D|nr:LysM peptidoglycan-binding domain-containing protein [Candidatus Epulopiscium viviparus]